MSASAQKLFSGFMRKHGISLRGAGEALGVTSVAVHEWLDGTRKPRAEFRMAIERWTNGVVPADAWLSREDRERIDDVVPFNAAE